VSGDLQPALDGERCVRCHQSVGDWYMTVPVTPMIDEVVCVPCGLLGGAP
jgi:hypothetical protein